MAVSGNIFHKKRQPKNMGSSRNTMLIRLSDYQTAIALSSLEKRKGG